MLRMLKFLRHIMKKDGLQNLILTGHIKGRRNREKGRATYIMDVCELLGEQNK